MCTSIDAEVRSLRELMKDKELLNREIFTLVGEDLLAALDECDDVDGLTVDEIEEVIDLFNDTIDWNEHMRMCIQAIVEQRSG